MSVEVVPDFSAVGVHAFTTTRAFGTLSAASDEPVRDVMARWDWLIARAAEHGVHPLDPDIGIEWPTDAEPVLSGKDAAAPTLEQARQAGLLPDYADCEAYLGSLRRAADARNPVPGRLSGPAAGDYPAGRLSGRCAATSSGRAQCSAVRHSPMGGTRGSRVPAQAS